MKHRIWTALLLAATLAIPALAQQNTQNSNPDQNQPTTQSAQPAQNQGQAQPSENQQTQQPAAQQGQTANPNMEPLKPETHEGFWGKLNPFARKKYVQRQMSPIRDRVNELDELTANNSKMIKDVDARAQEGIRMASAKADQADQHAMQAGQTAQQANSTAQEASTRLTNVQQIVSTIDQYKPTTETEIRFRPGQAVLSKKAKDALDEMATPLANQKGYVIEVQGFSPGKGQAAIQDSQNLANSVVRYLVLQHNVPVYRIYVLGMGNAPSMKQTAATETGAKAGRQVRGRRVEIALLKNDLEQLNAQPINTPGASTGTSGGMTGTTAQPSQTPPSQPATGQPAQPQTPPPSQQTPPPQNQIPPRR
jgi:outer membrane protein OmpA-like peptidoglycan-associated protein